MDIEDGQWSDSDEEKDTGDDMNMADDNQTVGPSSHVPTGAPTERHVTDDIADTNEEQNDHTQNASHKLAEAGLPARSLKHSKWAQTSLEDNPQTSELGEMSTFVNELYSQEEKERQKTKRVLLDFMADIDDACGKACADASKQRCPTVGNIAADMKAFAKSAVASQLGATTLRIISPKTSIPSGGQDIKPKRKQDPPLQLQEGHMNERRGHDTRERKPPANTARKQKSWAQVAATDKPQQHEAKQGQSNRLQHALPQKPRSATVNPKRIFLRLPDDAAQREQHPLFIIKAINACLPPNCGVETATSVRTGFALTLKAGTTPQDIMSQQTSICAKIGNGVLELDERWIVVKVRNIERMLTDLSDQGQITLREVDIAEEIYPDLEKAFGTTPQSALWGDILLDGKHSLRLTFRESEMTRRPSQIAILGSWSKVIYPPRRQPKAPLCQKCWKQHTTANCTSEKEVCRKCGSPEHKSMNHPPDILPSCVNCQGQHPANSPSCPEALSQKRGKTSSNTSDKTVDKAPAPQITAVEAGSEENTLPNSHWNATQESITSKVSW